MTADQTQSQRWVQALDQFEANISRCEQVLHPGFEPDLQPWPPPGLGPLPLELVGRARQLLGRSRELEAQLERAKAELGPLAPTHRRARPYPGRPTLSADL